MYLTHSCFLEEFVEEDIEEQINNQFIASFLKYAFPLVRKIWEKSFCSKCELSRITNFPDIECVHDRTRNKKMIGEEIMSYKINERCKKHPKYKNIVNLINHKLVHENIVEFDDVLVGEKFITEDGIIYEKIYFDRRGNAYTYGIYGLDYRVFSYMTKVKQLKEREEMTNEDFFKELEEDKILSPFSVKIKSQIPQTKTIGVIKVSCEEFNVNFSLDEDGNKVKIIQAGIKVENDKRKIIKLTDKLEIDFKGVLVCITPVECICRGFLVNIKIGDINQEELVPLQLGDIISIKVVRTHI